MCLTDVILIVIIQAKSTSNEAYINKIAIPPVLRPMQIKELLSAESGWPGTSSSGFDLEQTNCVYQVVVDCMITTVVVDDCMEKYKQQRNRGALFREFVSLEIKQPKGKKYLLIITLNMLFGIPTTGLLE